MIKEKMISDLSYYLIVDESYINSTLESINKKKLCDAHDFRRLVEIGLPIISVLSGVLKIDTNNAFGLIKDDKISYQDIIIILGIIAQDFKRFFSGITDDYSNYHWYKGEKEIDL